MAGRLALASLLAAVVLSAVPAASGFKCMVGVTGSYNGCGNHADSGSLTSQACGGDTCLLVTVTHKNISIEGEACGDVVFTEGICGSNTTTCDNLPVLGWDAHFFAQLVSTTQHGLGEDPVCESCNTEDCNTGGSDSGGPGQVASFARGILSGASLVTAVFGAVTMSCLSARLG